MDGKIWQNYRFIDRLLWQLCNMHWIYKIKHVFDMVCQKLSQFHCNSLDVYTLFSHSNFISFICWLFLRSCRKAIRFRATHTWKHVSECLFQAGWGFRELWLSSSWRGTDFCCVKLDALCMRQLVLYWPAINSFFFLKKIELESTNELVQGICNSEGWLID